MNSLILLLSFSIALAHLDIFLESGWKGWTDNSLKQEMSEYFSDIQEFWNFLEFDLTQPLQTIMDLAVKSETEKNLILSSLYNREYSARLEFYSSLENSENSNCAPFFIINSFISCSLSENLALKTVEFESNYDHIYRTGKGYLIAYLDITSSGFKEYHKDLIKFTQKYDLTYILRHLDIRGNSKDYLGGYGAEVIMKNMEYRPTEDVDFVPEPIPKWDTSDLSMKVIQNLISIESLPSVFDFMRNIPNNKNAIEETIVNEKLLAELNKMMFTNVKSI